MSISRKRRRTKQTKAERKPILPRFDSPFVELIRYAVAVAISLERHYKGSFQNVASRTEVAHSFQTPERLQPPASASDGTPSPNTRRQRMTQDEKDKQDLLRNVLTAFANHNPTVGYCQGTALFCRFYVERIEIHISAVNIHPLI